MRISLAAVLMPIAVLLGTILLVDRTTPRVHDVVRTSHGFEPRELSVRPGDTVRFSSELDRPFWPASDAHPSHGFNPTFDPRREIALGDTWEMVFDRPGSWPFHDHLAPGARGVVHVSGRLPSLDECLSFYGTSTVSAYCWGQNLMATVSAEGLDAAFAQAAQMASSPDFERQCHDVMHILGQAAYSAFSADHAQVYAHPMTTACGFGYYHGLIETILVDRGVHDLRPAAEYCEQFRVSDSLPTPASRVHATEACYHGVGHALFDSLDASLWGDARAMVSFTTRQCERVSHDEHVRELCMSGIYNSLANAYSSRSYGLIPPPFADSLCKDEPPSYRSRCFIELTVGVIRREQLSFVEALAYLRRVPADSYPIVFNAFIDDHVRHVMPSPTIEGTDALCDSFSLLEERRQCIGGVLRAFTYMATAEDTDLPATLFGFCMLQPDLLDACAGKAQTHLAAQMSPHETALSCRLHAGPDACGASGSEIY